MNLQKAVDFTKGVDENYFLGNVATRTENSDKRAGSYYELSSDEILEELASADWELEDTVETGMGTKRYYTSDIPGKFGMINLDELDGSEKLKVFEAKPGAQYLNVGIVKDVAHEDFDYSYMITSEKDNSGNEFILTFHPGPLIEPQEVAADFGSAFSDGDIITVKEAKDYGLVYAKLLRG